MQVKLELITPLWTADATKEARHVEGTGIAGSLRWWYEALIRGLGGWACAPTGDGCELNMEKFTQRRQRGCEHAGVGSLCFSCEQEALAQNGLCAACQVFGATSWARTFRLVVEDATQMGYPPTGKERVRAARRNARGGKPAYFFPPGRTGLLTLGVLPRRPGDEDTVRLVYGLLEFIRRNAALGAKTNLGYGLFEWEEEPEKLPDAAWLAAEVSRRAEVGRRGQNGRWPDLREMFFAEVELPSRWRPEDFVNFKYDLRAAFREGGTIERLIPDGGKRRRLRHFLLGTTEDDPNQASKVKMALLPDCRTLRVWGWVPKGMPGNVKRKAVMSLLYQRVRALGDISRWREFNSPRDTVNRFRPDQEEAYLRSLLEEGI